MGGIGIWQLVIVLLIVLVIFGTKKFRSLGGDLGSAIKSFKKAVKEEEDEGKKKEEVEEQSGRVIEGEVTSKKKEKT